jgi:hypothetical protein
MKAFEVLVNGQRRCVAGVNDPTSVHLSVCFSCTALPDGRRPTQVDLNISGWDDTTRERLQWKVPSVRARDEILVRIIESNEIDPPNHRQPKSSETDWFDLKMGEFAVEHYRSQLKEIMKRLDDGARRCKAVLQRLAIRSGNAQMTENPHRHTQSTCY